MSRYTSVSVQRCSALLIFAGLIGVPTPGGAQWTPDAASTAWSGPRQQVQRTHPKWLPPLASALLPGSGQFLQGQERGAIYVVVEVFLLTRFIGLQNDAQGGAARYKGLSFEVARGQFNPQIRDTVFEYFEQMQKFIESGPFDTDPGSALVPPVDELTYNGSQWKLARQTFFANPDSIPDPDSIQYQLALQFYRQRAVGANFRWSWRNAGIEQDLYRQAIQQSDEDFRRASQQLGLLLANHLLSAIDAFVSVRLSRNGRPVEVSSAVWVSAGGREVRGRLSVRVGI